jgi:hypothetical protein
MEESSLSQSLSDFMGMRGRTINKLIAAMVETKPSLK